MSAAVTATAFTINLAVVREPSRLAKTYFRDAGGLIRRRDADNVSSYAFLRDEPCESLAAFAGELRDLVSHRNVAIIRGVPKPDATHRRKTDIDSVPTVVLTVDRDDFALPPGVCAITNPAAVVAAARATLADPAFHSAACVGVISASAGMVKVPQPDGTIAYRYAAPGEQRLGRVRLFFVADRPVSDAAWKAWLTQMCERDVSSADSIQLQYTAAPVFEGDLHDPIAERVFALPGEAVVVVPASVPTPAAEAAAAAAAAARAADEATAARLAAAARAAAPKATPAAGSRVFMDWRRGFDAVGFMSALGCRTGNFRGSRAPCACPNAHAHTDGRGKGKDTSAVLIRRPDGSYSFHCKHSHCADITLFKLCEENPDLADRYASIEWEPEAKALTAARHRRIRDARSVAATAAEASAVDRVAAIELERSIARDNARIEAAEIRADIFAATDTSKKGLAVRAAIAAAMADAASAATQPAPRRKESIAHLSAARARAATFGMSKDLVDHLASIERSLTLCQRGLRSRLVGPTGTFDVGHQCGRAEYCPHCAVDAALTWVERICWGGIANLSPFAGGRVIFWRLPMTHKTAAAAYDEFDGADAVAKRAARAHGVALATHYVEAAADAPDTVDAYLNACAVVPADAVATYVPAGAVIFSMPVVSPLPPAADRPAYDDLGNSPYWLAAATIANWWQSHSHPTALRLHLSPAAVCDAESALLASGRRRWRCRRPSRAWSAIFPDLPPENTRVAELIDTADIDARVATGDMTHGAAVAAGQAALAAARKRVDAATNNPAASQPVPFADARRLGEVVELLAEWRAAAADAAADPAAEAAARESYVAAAEGEVFAVRRWMDSHAAAAGPPAAASTGGR